MYDVASTNSDGLTLEAWHCCMMVQVRINAVLFTKFILFDGLFNIIHKMNNIHFSTKIGVSTGKHNLKDSWYRHG